jgi:hypothetical protein
LSQAIIAVTSLAGVGVAMPALAQSPEITAPVGWLRPAADFAGIADERARSIALFEEAGKVLQHPRCLNCHAEGDRPTQTDRMQPHRPLVTRGADGHGGPGLVCRSCHHQANFAAAGVPGNPAWRLAPAIMVWANRSLGSICEQIKDPARNGGMDMAAVLRHAAEDTLVGWAWSPGTGRTPAPGTQTEFGALLRAWAETGAHCPKS